MKHFNLLISFGLIFLLTGFVLTHSGWLPTKKANHAARHNDMHAHVRANDLFSTDAARRWRNSEPTHWRGYMLQR